MEKQQNNLNKSESITAPPPERVPGVRAAFPTFYSSNLDGAFSLAEAPWRIWVSTSIPESDTGRHSRWGQGKKSGNRQCSSHISERRHAYQIPSSKKKPSKSASWEWLVSYHILPWFTAASHTSSQGSTGLNLSDWGPPLPGSGSILDLLHLCAPCDWPFLWEQEDFLLSFFRRQLPGGGERRRSGTLLFF